MRITGIETLHADGGWRTISFVKLSTDAGITGWSEYVETVWNPGLTPVIGAMAEHAIGQDPRAYLQLSTRLQIASRLAAGGLTMQAAAAIENAAIDAAAKAAGVPAWRLLGGPIRSSIPVYWSHAGVFRAVNPRVFDDLVGTPPLRSADGFKAIGEEARALGFTALKTNPVRFTANGAVMPNPGFRPSADHDPSGNGRLYPLAGLIEQLEALRDGAGPEMEIMLDLNFSLRGEGIRRVTQELDRLGLAWLEIDTDVPAALADVGRRLRTPIASLESLHGIVEYRPWLEARAADIALIDPSWNGVVQGLRIAALADAFGIQVAAHNCYGHLGDRISAAFCACIPNLRIMEMEWDDVPWHDDLVDAVPIVENGQFLLDERPGWGCDVVEEAVRAHPPRHDPARPWLK
jgi:galactonate dehydratase